MTTPDVPQTPSRRAALISTLILIVGGTLIGLLLVAALIGLFPQLEPGGQRFLFTELDGDTFRHQPGQVRPPAENRVLEEGVRFDDADGFRRPARVTDRYPIAVIGDSFTDGGQVPWTDMLADELNMPVRNLGWSGFGPLEYAEIAGRFLEPDHDWVLVAYFEGNDLSNIQTSRQRADQNGGTVELDLTRNTDAATPAATPVARTLDQYTDIILDPQERYLYPLTHIRADGSIYEVAYISDYLWWLNGERETYLGSRNAEELRQILTGIQQAAGRACVAIVYVPTKEYVYFRDADPAGNRQYVLENARELTLDEGGWLTHLPPAPVEYDTLAAHWDNQRAAVREIAENAGWGFIDLAPAFVAAAQSQIAYYTYDSHWNSDGHRIAAQTVAAYIEGQPCVNSANLPAK